MPAQLLQRDDLQGALVSGGQHHRSRTAILESLPPAHGNDAPTITRHQPWKLELRSGSDQIVADPALVGQEIGSDDGAHHVPSQILWPGRAPAVPVKPGHRVDAARFQFPAHDVPLAGHRVSLPSVTHPGSGGI